MDNMLVFWFLSTFIPALLTALVPIGLVLIFARIHDRIVANAHRRIRRRAARNAARFGVPTSSAS